MASSDRLQLQGGPPRHCCSSSPHGLPKFETARPRISILAFFLLLLQFMSTIAAGYRYPGKIGVDIELKYGRGIIPPKQIVRLLQLHAVSRARLFDANVTMLRAFAHSGIDLIISVPNEEVPTVARSPIAARRWVADHIAPFPATKISAILVGYHWLSDRRLNRTLLLPAILNVNAALGFLGLTSRAIRVSTSSSMDLLSRPAWVFPPSLATFKPSLRPILRTLLAFLIQTDSFFDVDISPYDAYINDPSVSLRFVLFESTAPIRDTNTGLEYFNMFDVQADAINSALQALLPLTTGAADTVTDTSKPLGPNATIVSAPSKGQGSANYHSSYASQDGNNKRSPRGHGIDGLGLDQIPGREAAAATITNARIYNQNLINHALTAAGTPRYPSRPLTAYIFELFNEALRFGPLTQKHLGLFYPNGSSVYPIDFCSPYF